MWQSVRTLSFSVHIQHIHGVHRGVGSAAAGAAMAAPLFCLQDHAHLFQWYTGKNKERPVLQAAISIEVASALEKWNHAHLWSILRKAHMRNHTHNLLHPLDTPIAYPHQNCFLHLWYMHDIHQKYDKHWYNYDMYILLSADPNQYTEAYAGGIWEGLLEYPFDCPYTCMFYIITYLPSVASRTRPLCLPGSDCTHKTLVLGLGHAPSI